MNAEQREKRRLRMAEWRKRNPEREREIGRRSERKNAAKKNAKRRVEYSIKGRDAYLRRVYGITLADEQRMLVEQAGACAICLETFDGNPRHRHLDHVHATRKVRGILCHWCNWVIGMARERAGVLERASTYVRERS